ncbi:MAG: hypothetical protein M5U13_04980 [Thermoanaerobaculia bacterium]|nr:hypothetical protein [Thermoanaerobaculia bacterium]
MRTLVLGATLAVVLLGVPLGAEPLPRSQVLELEACEIRLSDLGRRARFQGSVLFEVSTLESGAPSSIELLPDQRLAVFLDVDHLKSCLSSWRLASDSQYKITASFGTTAEMSGKWSVSLLVPDGPTIRLRQPKRARHDD